MIHYYYIIYYYLYIISIYGLMIRVGRRAAVAAPQLFTDFPHRVCSFFAPHPPPPHVAPQLIVN